MGERELIGLAGLVVLFGLLILRIPIGLAMIFEAGAWWIAFKEFRRSKGKLGYFMAMRETKDPAVLTVLFEDSAAMLGLVVAFVGIWLGDQLGIPEIDAAASIVIGLILAVVAALLAYEAKGLLIGEGASPETLDRLRQVIGADPFGPALDSLNGQNVRDRLLSVARLASPGAARRCEILFISTSEERRLAAILAAVEGVPTLTVADMAGFAENGGIIRLTTVATNSYL